MAKPKTISCYLGIKHLLMNGFSISTKTMLKHWQNLCKRVLKVKTWKENTSLLCNQTSRSQVSAAGHRRMIQNSPRKVSNHSKWLLLLLNSIWGFNSEWQQFGAWSTKSWSSAKGQQHLNRGINFLYPAPSPPNRTELWTGGIWGQQWDHQNLQAKALS